MANPAINMTVIDAGADNDWDRYVVVAPHFPISEQVNHKTIISKGESGRERRRSKVSTARRQFTLNFQPPLSVVKLDRIWNLYLDRKGAAYSFSWKRPARTPSESGVIYNVRFTNDGLTREWFSSNLHKIGLNLTELFSNEL